MELLHEIARALEAGDADRVAELTRQALGQNLAAKQILDHGLIAGMNTIGASFKEHEIFLPDVLLAAKAMYAGLAVLKPQLTQEQVPALGKVVIGSVQGDLHDIGKNLVGIMLKGAGFEVIDLGNDVAPELFVETAVRENAGVIGMSALLTTTMPAMKQVVELVKARGHTGRIKTIVGGAPLTEQFAREIGADAYGYDAANAVDTVRLLLKPLTNTERQVTS
jgi:5-methyltetrahydrofolate--homocysteine methyltransferase